MEQRYEVRAVYTYPDKSHPQDWEVVDLHRNDIVSVHKTRDEANAAAADLEEHEVHR
ncbi:hypothetical protein [Litchfieldella rifensis]|uniref:Uncharacterized protein n=1 Tax=Litchfieldella rifensis TaxID=762643 RepID=A0ABV7LHU7_9GAMM